MNYFDIKLVLTKSAKYFIDPKIYGDKENYLEFEKNYNCKIYNDNDEWDYWDIKKEGSNFFDKMAKHIFDPIFVRFFRGVQKLLLSC